MEFNDIFFEHEPPPHGLIKLRNKLALAEREMRRRPHFAGFFWRNRLAQAVALVVLAVTTAIVASLTHQTPNLFQQLAAADQTIFFQEAGYGAAMQSGYVSINGENTYLVAQRTPAKNNVRFYWVR
jgi:anti-sigma-K factor RskA